MKRIRFWDTSGKFDYSLLRRAVVSNAKFLVGGESGRIKDDPIFEKVTEGRYDKVNGYSACGDLCQVSLLLAGFRDENILNRGDDGLRKPWVPGVNISWLVNKTGQAWIRQKPKTDFKLEPGDMALIANYPSPGVYDEHVFVVVEQTEDKLISCDYGQWDNKRGVPSARVITRNLKRDSSGYLSAGRRIQGKLDITKLDFTETAFVLDDFEGGVVDDNPYSEGLVDETWLSVGK